MLEKIEGIIIKTIDYGETNKIITIYSKKIGKFTAFARGAKKPRSRMSAVTQPFILGQFFVYLNKGLSTIQQGEIIDSFRAIREDIIKTAYTAYICELLDKLVEEKTSDPFLYNQLLETLHWISKNEDSEIPIMMLELKLFEKGGFSPALFSCVNCTQTEGLTAFSIREGGLLCNRCTHIDQQATRLSEIQIKLLQFFLKVGLEQVGDISVKKENRQLFRQLIDAYYEAYGGYYLKSKRFLRQLDNLI